MTNSPEIDHAGIHDAHEGGIANANGFAIEGFAKDGVPFSLDVVDGRITGIGRTSILAGLDLVGATIAITLFGVDEYLVRISDVSETAYIATHPGRPPAEHETYLLEWMAVPGGVPTGHWKNICGHPPDEADALGMNTLHALVFEGDRIDAIAKTVYDVDADGMWFNIGCAGHAIAKLALTGRTEPAARLGFATTLGERQAMLKMFAADYCGDGTPFTIAGQPLYWQDDRGWLAYPEEPRTVEARWSARGASCLEVPRVEAHPSPDTAVAFPDLAGAMADHCDRLPLCTASSPDPLVPEYVISANP